MANKKRYFKLIIGNFDYAATSDTESRYSLPDEMRKIINGVRDGSVSAVMQLHTELTSGGFALLCPIADLEDRHESWNWHRNDVVECDKDGNVFGGEDLF